MRKKIGTIYQVAKGLFKRNFESLAQIDVSLGGPRVKLDFSRKGLIWPERTGSNPEDHSHFYNSEFTRLYEIYFGYIDSFEYKYSLLYADLLAIKPSGFNAITKRCVEQDKITVSLDGSPYSIPPKIRSHGKEALRFFQETARLKKLETGEWENNIAFRVTQFSDSGVVECSFAMYFDQLSTNLTVDWASGKLDKKSATIRSTVEAPVGGRLHSLENSILANTLGTAVMFYDGNLEPMIRVRAKTLASIAGGGLHCTVSGVLEPMNELTPGSNYSFDLFLPGTEHEIRRETGLEPDQYLLFPVAFARELPRAGKPQLFWIAISLVDAEYFRKSCSEAEEASEYIVDEKATQLPDQLRDEEEFLAGFTYEGRASFEFGRRFVVANRAELLRMIDRKKTALLT
jgi:hypothetical protein